MHRTLYQPGIAGPIEKGPSRVRRSGWERSIGNRAQTW